MIPVFTSLIASFIHSSFSGNRPISPTEVPEDLEKFEGVSMWMVVKPMTMNTQRRKYIVDLGGKDRNRFSIYLDEKNDLCFRIIDDFSEIHTVKLPQKKYPYLDRYSLLTFEYGRSDRYSFLKIILNGKYEAKNQFDYKIDLSIDPSKWENMAMGVDLIGKNNGKFEITEHLMYRQTLNKEEKSGLMTYFFNKYFPEKVSQ